MTLAAALQSADIKLREESWLAAAKQSAAARINKQGLRTSEIQLQEQQAESHDPPWLAPAMQSAAVKLKEDSRLLRQADVCHDSSMEETI